MGYERKKLQIVGGGLNLLPPGDKAAEKDALLLQNFRTDRDGKFTSRYGYTGSTRYNGAGTLHSAMVFNTAIYWGTSSGKLYYASGTSPVATGFDGNRLGMVGMLGWNWIVNRAQQGRHNVGSGYSAYGVAAPASGPTAAAGSAGNPNGTYSVWVTYVYNDAGTGLMTESDPFATGTSITVTNQQITLTAIPTSSDTRVNGRNIYLSGGTLGQAYLAIPYASAYASIEDNTTTTATITLSDLAITNMGIVMSITNDLPPAASGVGGPYFDRLIAWSTADNVNRLFWTPVGQPQYWPGAANPVQGNWVDVGADGEAILWCTFHTNMVVIYKQRSIWRLIGDVLTGTLECMDPGIGLTNAFAVAPARNADYFVGPNGLYRNNLDVVQDVTGDIRPLFQTISQNSYLDQPPGNITTQVVTGPVTSYKCALGYAMGKLYLGYTENSTAGIAAPILVLHEASGRWSYFRSGLMSTAVAGFLFDGSSISALGTDGSGNGVAYGLDDFAACATADGPNGIDVVYGSHYEDAGMPDNQKNWLECVVDCEVSSPDSLTVYATFDTGTATVNLAAAAGASPAYLPLGSIGGAAGAAKRVQASFPIGPYVSGAVQPDGYLAKNIAIRIVGYAATKQVVIHNVYLYYYVEARLAAAASTLPSDLGVGKVKQCKELELDIDASLGAVNCNIYSDLPGNQLAVRQTPAIAQNNGRAIWKFPFPVTEGYLWRVALTTATAGGVGMYAGAFRLYSARLLMRVMGVYVEAYEAANGFVWDSQEMTFDSGLTHTPRMYAIALTALPIKRFREISLQIETFGSPVTLNFLTDLPGNAQAVRFTTTVNTGSAGRRFYRIPLPAGTSAPIEGRMCRIQLSGAAKFILYEAAVEVLAVGVYVEAYEAAGGAVYDSREQDFSTPKVKEARELELDIETTGAVTAQLLSDITTAQTFTAVTSGRQKVMLPLTLSAGGEQFVEGRLLRLILSGTNAFRLYGARLKIRAFGEYLLAAETSAGALWDTTDLDLGMQTVKQLRELELDIWAYGGYTVTVYTDLPGNAMSARVITGGAATNGRTAVQIPLPQGWVPGNYIFGRLVRVTITSASNFKLFGARIHARPIGVYVESYEAAGGAVWDSMEQDLGSPLDKCFDEVRFELDTDGAANVAIYTDLPGEAMTERVGGALTAGATGRHWATVPLANLASATPPWTVEGRSIRMVVSSAAGFRIYRAQVRAARVGRYLAASTLNGNDSLTTLEFDFASERVKQYKKLELDVRADGALTLELFTNQSGQMALEYTTQVVTPNGRATFYLPLPPGLRGRLLRINAQSASAARIYKLRVWARPLNEPKADWGWTEYPLEGSEELPAWKDIPVPETPSEFKWAELPVEPTKPEWTWAPLPVAPTAGQDPAQWFWAKVLTVDETPDTWSWVDVPFEVSQ